MNTVKQEIYRGAVYAALETVFGREWIELGSAEQRLISDDYELAATQEDLTVREYQQSIGRDNLGGYADCLAIQAGQAWRKT